MALISNAFNRSLMVYYLVPLIKAEAITKREIDHMEADVKRHQFGLQGDLRPYLKGNAVHHSQNSRLSWKHATKAAIEDFKIKQKVKRDLRRFYLVPTRKYIAKLQNIASNLLKVGLDEMKHCLFRRKGR